MDAVEKAIRNAFAKGDPEDRAYREKVYRSVHEAMKRAAAGNPSITQEAMERRREALKATITRIERDFVPARPAAAEPAVPTVDLPADREMRRLRDDPGFRGGEFPDGPDPVIGPSPELDDVRTRPGRGTRRPRRRGAALAFVLVTLLAAVAAAAWWTGSFGLLRSAEERDTSVPNPPATLDEEDFEPGPGPGQGNAPLSTADDGMRDWISVFSPDDPSDASAPGDATAEAMTEDGDAFLRIRSGPSGSEIAFDVGQGILEQIAGKKAVFAIVARAPEDETQISVSCEFGEAGDCGRKRFAVAGERTDLLFEVQLPAENPGSAGTIAINSDVQQGGKPVDIFEIKVDVQ